MYQLALDMSWCRMNSRSHGANQQSKKSKGSRASVLSYLLVPHGPAEPWPAHHLNPFAGFHLHEVTALDSESTFKLAGEQACVAVLQHCGQQKPFVGKGLPKFLFKSRAT